MATPLRLLDTHTHALCIFQRALLRNHLKNQMNECLRSDLFNCFSFAVATTSKQYDTFIGDKVQVHAYYYLFKFESKSRFKATGKCLVLTSAFGIFVLLLKNELKNERHTGELIPYDLAIHIYTCACTSSTLTKCMVWVCLFTMHSTPHIPRIPMPIIVNHTIEIEIIVIKCILWCLKFLWDRNRAINMLQW